MPAKRALTPPEPIWRFDNPEDGRAIVYYIQRGDSASDDVVSKYLEIRASATKPPFLRMKLSCTFVNRYYQYRELLLAGTFGSNVLAEPLDEDSEKEKGKRLLFPKQICFFGDAPVDPPFSSSSLASKSKTPAKQNELLSLVDLPWEVRKSAVARILEETSSSTPCLEDLDPLPAIFDVCEQLRALWSNSGLRILSPLRPIAEISEKRKRWAVKKIHGDSIAHLMVEAPVVYDIAEKSWEDFVAAFHLRPGLHLARELMYVDKTWGYADSMDVYCANTLLRQMEPLTHSFDLPQAFSALVAPTTHGSIFGWLQYAKLTVETLTIRVTGMDIWDKLDFGNFGHYRALPLIALISSIIAYKPRSIQEIVFINLGIFKEAVDFLGQSIPTRTPLTGKNPLLNQLVEYPFEGKLKDIERVTEVVEGSWERVHREGNLFGLRSEMTWQGLILKARHGINEAAWEFYA